MDPESAEIIVTEGGATVYPGTGQCIIEKRDFCPRGIVGIIDLNGFRPPPTRPPLDFDILFGGALGAGMYQIIFDPPDNTTSSKLWFFGADGILHEAKVEEGVLDQKPVSIGTIVLDPGVDYQFVATAEGDGIREISTVGSVEVKR